MKILHHMTPQRKTIVAIIIFSLAGILSFFIRIDEWQVILPLFIFYCFFIFNSYFSIKLFFGIIPHGLIVQDTIDFFLFLAYLALAASLGNPLLFSFLIVLFFLLGSLKYVLLLKIIKDHPRLLRRKIAANILAALLGLLTLGGIISGYTLYSTWLLDVVFLIANILIFFVWPLYRLDNSI